MNVLSSKPEIGRSLSMLSKVAVRFSTAKANTQIQPRYVPKKRMKFNYRGGDGPMSLIFKGPDSSYKRYAPHTWKLSFLSAVPASYYAFLTLGVEYWFCYPLAFTPALFQLYHSKKAKNDYENGVWQMWILKNGD